MSYVWAFGNGETGSGAVVTHTYTAVGSYAAVVTATNEAGSMTATTEVNVIAATRIIAYTYDPLGRLIAATDTTGESFAYAYDAVGNRTALTDTAGVHTYTYDAANRLTGVDGVSYTWDARGNLRSNGVFTYTYDGAGRMVRAESVSATVVYTYGLDSLLVGRSAGGAAATYAWDWATGVPEMLSDGERLYLVGEETLGWADGVEWSYPLGDALGSVRQVVDGAGEVLDDRTWTPFGVEEGTAQGGLGYTGEWWDAEVSLLYLRARWYDPAVGIFTQADTYVLNLITPQSSHDYAYGNNDPVFYVDPTGYSGGIPGFLVVMGGTLGVSVVAQWVRADLMFPSLEDIREISENDASFLVNAFFIDDFNRDHVIDFYDGDTPDRRLELILQSTYSNPFQYFKGDDFKDSGFNDELQDGDDQVGHFLTGVGIAHYLGSDSYLAIGASIGHEMIGDNYLLVSVPYQICSGLSKIDMVENFRKAMEADAQERTGDRDQLLWEILTAVKEWPSTTDREHLPQDTDKERYRYGNTMKDLRLTVKAFRFVKTLDSSGFADRPAAARWLRDNLME